MEFTAAGEAIDNLREFIGFKVVIRQTPSESAGYIYWFRRRFEGLTYFKPSQSLSTVSSWGMEFASAADEQAGKGNGGNESSDRQTSSVIAGQSWTRQLGKCEDPNCVQVHVDGSHAWLTEKSDGQDTEKYVSPAERIVNPLDVLDVKPDASQEFIYIVGTRGQKVTVIGDSLAYMKDSLQDLTLRSNLVSNMNGVEKLPNLTRLELYDNVIESISHIDGLPGLRILDLSFNAIRDMGAVAACPLLEELYIAQNKLRKIEGVNGMVHLKILDLGANRIRSMAGAGLFTLVSLESLWLGKNKIECIQGINALTKLRKLDVQNNRLQSLEGEGAGDEDDERDSNGISGLTSLEELYLAFNHIPCVEGLPLGSPLSTIDFSNNPVDDLTGLEEHKGLSEVWMNASNLATLDQLKPLQQLPGLNCLYLEHSPVARDFEYRKAVTAMLPPLEQLDATVVNKNRSA
tara:strand:- start:669 stop:2048 length:1380 start_codon:yes stop_codon:yes gene_type:complete